MDVPYGEELHMAPTHTSDIALLMRFFGKKPGQDLRAFKTEVDALSAEDRAELAALIRELDQETPSAA